MDHMHVTPTASREICFKLFSKIGDIHICWRSFICSNGNVMHYLFLRRLSREVSNTETFESEGERSWVTNTWTMFVEKVLILLSNVNLYCISHTINHINTRITSTSITSTHCMNMPYQHSLHCLICKLGCWFTISNNCILYKLCYQIYLSMLKNI